MIRIIALTILTLTISLAACGGDKAPSATTAKTTKKAPKPRHPGLVLLAKAPCKTCHNRKVKAIGPSYVALAQRYADADDDMIKTLVGKVKNGGKGNWGEVMMNPHPDIPEADIEQMIRYMLSVKP